MSLFPSAEIREKIGATLFTAVAFLTVIDDLLALPLWPAGLLGWIAVVFFQHRLSPFQLFQGGSVFVIGAVGTLYAWKTGESDLLRIALSQNLSLVTMLGSVQLLRLIGGAEEKQSSSVFGTMSLVHLTGAVINLSSVVIFGDRMAGRRRLDSLQAVLLSRSFSLAAFWSPFFASMAVALSFAPRADPLHLMYRGAPLALAGLIWSVFEIHLRMRKRSEPFYGVSMRWESIRLPVLLGVSVLSVHRLLPAVSLLTIITLLAPVFVFIVLMFRSAGEGRPRTAIAVLSHEWMTRLPAMGGELLLFLSAGLLSAAATGLLRHVSVEFSGRTVPELLLLFGGILLLSCAGIHPLILITAVAATATSNADAAASLYLMLWAIGMAVNPISGLHLTIEGRYGISGFQLLKNNLPFALFLIAVCVTEILLLR